MCGSSDRCETEFTLLVTGEPSEELDLLDNAFHLLQVTDFSEQFDYSLLIVYDLKTRFGWNKTVES